MNLIISTLQQTDRGPQVKNLHYILFFLIKKLNDPTLNTIFSEPGVQRGYTAEVLEQQYGPTNAKLVGYFQAYLRLPESQVVDNPTAEKLNELLREHRGLEIDRPEGYPYEVSENLFIISGRVTNAEKKGLEKYIVTVSEYDIDKITEIKKSEPTDKEGNFSLDLL